MGILEGWNIGILEYRIVNSSFDFIPPFQCSNFPASCDVERSEKRRKAYDFSVA